MLTTQDAIPPEMVPVTKNMSNPQAALRALKMAQQKLDTVEKEISFAKYTGNASGVSIVITGRGDIVDINIDSSIQSAPQLAQAILAAHKKASEQREALYRTKMGPMAGGKLPPGINLPGITKIQDTIYKVKENVGNAAFASEVANNGVAITINGKDDWQALSIKDEVFSEGHEVVVALLRQVYKTATQQKDAAIKSAFSEASSDFMPLGMSLPKFLF